MEAPARRRVLVRAPAEIACIDLPPVRRAGLFLRRSSHVSSGDFTAVDHKNPDQGPDPDGVTLSAVHLPNPQAVYTVLFSHGNAEDIRDVAPLLNEIHESGFAVFAYDYRGYGSGDGVPTEENAYKDIDAAYAYVTGTLGVAPARIIAYGRSVGGGPAVDLASRWPLAAGRPHP